MTFIDAEIWHDKEALRTYQTIIERHAQAVIDMDAALAAHAAGEVPRSVVYAAMVELALMESSRAVVFLSGTRPPKSDIQ